MDDLIKRLENGLPAMKTVMGGYTLDLDTAQAERMEAASALTEAQATIARQQVMLDRALESNGDLMVRIGKLEEALREVIDASDNTGIEMGTVGMRVAERVEDIARAALAQGHGE